MIDAQPDGGLLDWLEAPRSERGVHFAKQGDGWAFESFAALGQRVRAVAAFLLDAGLERDDVVALVLADSGEFLAAFMGTLLAGGTPCPVVPPAYFRDPDEYVAHGAGILDAARPRWAIADDRLRPLVERAVTAAGSATTVLSLAGGDERHEVTPRAQARLALLQFTSGSSGRPRGVRVPREALEGNLRMIARWLGFGPERGMAHWLPLYHDLGLIGCTLSPLTHGGEVWVLRPDQFILDPIRWLEPLGTPGAAATTAAPNFGFVYALKRVDPAKLEGRDFSGCTGIVSAAERIDPVVMSRFAELLEPHGFRRSALSSAYGLAEATLAGTALYPPRTLGAIRVDWSALQFGDRVAASERLDIADPRIEDGTEWVVGSGTAHPGIDVAIADEDGAPLADGLLGEIVVESACGGDGYVGDANAGTTRFVDGAIRTGDAGFVVDDELYVIGRMGDSLKARGRTIYMEDLEARLASIPGVSAGRSAVVGAPDGTAIAAFVEREGGEWEEQAAVMLRRVVGGDIAVEVVACERGTIPRTSSGKPRRRMLWQQMADRRSAI